jgi:hypothetical protein
VTSCTLALSPVNSHIGVLSLGKASRFNFSMECSESFIAADCGDGCCLWMLLLLLLLLLLPGLWLLASNYWVSFSFSKFNSAQPVSRRENTSALMAFSNAGGARAKQSAELKLGKATLALVN